MRFHGIFRNVQSFGNLLSVVVQADQHHHILLSGGQREPSLVILTVHRLTLEDAVDHLLHNLLRRPFLAISDNLDRMNHINVEVKIPGELPFDPNAYRVKNILEWIHALIL
jgi:hypothetical protein